MARPCRESAGFAPASCARAPSDPCRAPASSSDHIHLIAAVQLFDLHVHAIGWARLDRFPDDIGLNRQLAAAAVHQDAEGNPFGAAEVRQLIERRPHRPPGIEHVVHDDRVLVGEIAGNVRFADHGFRPDRFQIVAVECDVERPAWNLGRGAFLLLDEFGDALGELDAAALNADEHEIVGAVRQLHDRHGHTLQRPRHRAGVEERGAFFHFWGPRHLEAETYTYAYTGVKGGLPLSTLCTFAIAIA